MFVTNRCANSDVDEEQDEPLQYNPVTCTDLQPGSDIYVFGPELQIGADGSGIPPKQQKYIWIDAILHKLQRPVNLLSPIPSNSPKHLKNVVGGLQRISGDNMMSGMCCRVW